MQSLMQEIFFWYSGMVTWLRTIKICKLLSVSDPFHKDIEHYSTIMNNGRSVSFPGLLTVMINGRSVSFPGLLTVMINGHSVSFP